MERETFEAGTSRNRTNSAGKELAVKLKLKLHVTDVSDVLANTRTVVL